MKYRKKPVVIEAVEWTGDYTPEVHKFLGDIAIRVIINHEKKMLIPTLEGQMIASVGDYVIRGIKMNIIPVSQISLNLRMNWSMPSLNWSKMRLLITGGCGFIGNNLVDHMLKDPRWEIVVNVDKLGYSSTEVPRYGKYSFRKVDITNASALDKIFDLFKPTHVMHLAAESHVDNSIIASGVDAFVQTNVQGTLNLLESARKHKVERFLYISTDEVYGSINPNEYPAREDAILKPRNPYAATKAAGEHLVMAYNATFKLNVGITRCTNNYGHYQFPEKMVPLSIHRIMKDQKIPVYGTGKQMRDWIHVSDHCRALEAVLHRGYPGEIFNVAGNNELTNLELVNTLCRILNKDPDNCIEYVEDRPGHDLRYSIDSGKIGRELGIKPLVEWQKGIADTIKWYHYRLLVFKPTFSYH